MEEKERRYKKEESPDLRNMTSIYLNQLPASEEEKECLLIGLMRDS